jgi:hypothetical protein
VPPGIVRVLARSWAGLVAVALLLYALALEVAITGFVPAVSDPDLALAICWSALLAMLAVLFVALIGASARDLTGVPAAQSADPNATRPPDMPRARA